jgi:Predicted membrane protein (DUF2207) C-terminal domain
MSTAVARAQSPAIKYFESDIRIGGDGSALVIENYDFSRAPGAFERRIPTRAPGKIANNRYYIDIANVNDDGGNDLAYRVVGSSSFMTVSIPRLTSARLQIAYRVRNAVQFGAQDDEFVWIANPPNVTVAGGHVSVTLPEAAAGQLRAQAFLRHLGSASSATLWSFDGRVPAVLDKARVESSIPGALAPGVAMVVYTSVPAGLLTPPNAFVRAGWFLRANPIVFFPVAVLLVMLVVWRLKPRDPDPRRSVAPLYEPPAGLSPAEAGLLVDDSVDPRDISATLIDLAVRGYVRLERKTAEHGHSGDRDDYIVRIVKPREEWNALAPHEAMMMFHTFYGGQWTELSSLRLRFPDIVPAMRSSIVNSLKQKGMYRIDPDTAPIWRQAFTAAGFGLAYLLAHVPGTLFLAPVLLQSDSVSVPSSWPLLVVCLAASALIVYLLGGKASTKTLRGMRKLVEVRGFAEFMRTVEGDRISRMEPGLFEKYLPYAMALGIEHKWTRAFDGIAIEQPEWADWGVGGLFNSLQFGHALDSAFSTVLPVRAARGRYLTAEPTTEPSAKSAAVGT